MSGKAMMPVGSALAKFRAMTERAGIRVDLDGPDEVEIQHEVVVDRAQLRDHWLGRVWAHELPPVFAAPSVDDVLKVHGPKVAEDLALWARRPEPANLVLLGPVGTGKTHAAIAAAQLWLSHRFDSLRSRRTPFAFCATVELLDQLRPGGDQLAAMRCQDADLLLLDDLGAERATEWAAERLFAIVNRRWLEQRPTIVTTNVPADQMSDALGDRNLSRLAGGALVLRLSGEDLRMKRWWT